jgi:hypothetical protein
MEDSNNSTSAPAIAAAELIKLSVPKLAKALEGLSLDELRAVLAAEKAEGDGKTRTTALDAIGDALEAKGSNRHGIGPDEAGGPNLDYVPPVDGGPVDLELPPESAGEILAPPTAPDAIAAAVDQVGDHVPRELEAFAGLGGLSVFDDDSMKWSAEKVLTLLREGGLATLVIAGDEVRHLELAPIDVAIVDFERVSDGRLLYLGNIELDGIGLEHPLPISAVWLVFDSEDGAIIVRRCAMAGELMLEPGRRVGFPPRTLIF